MSSLAALTAVATAPLWAFLLHQPRCVIVLALFTAVLIFVRHRENIARLLAGTEPKIGGGKTSVPVADAP
jgi:glycerol-3-phosphate acyltransferase PlsY